MNSLHKTLQWRQPGAAPSINLWVIESDGCSKKSHLLRSFFATHPNILHSAAAKNPSKMNLSMHLDPSSIRLHIPGFNNVPVADELAEKHQFLFQARVGAICRQTFDFPLATCFFGLICHSKSQDPDYVRVLVGNADKFCLEDKGANTFSLLAAGILNPKASINRTKRCS